MARKPYLSLRQKLERLLKHVKAFDRKWLDCLAPARESTQRQAAREMIYEALHNIVGAVTHTESLARVSIPPDVKPLGLTVEGEIVPPEYPDRPVYVSQPRHLIEYPPIAWQDQREEALRWGDRDPARWGDEPPPVDPRPMGERLDEWEEEIVDTVQQEAPARLAAEEIYRAHGIFEEAMPENANLDRIQFRMEGEWIERALRHDLMSHAERILLDYPEKLEITQPARDTVMQTPPAGLRVSGTHTAPTADSASSPPLADAELPFKLSTTHPDLGRARQLAALNHIQRKTLIELSEATKNLDLQDLTVASLTAIHDFFSGKTASPHPATRRKIEALCGKLLP
jgi:hypothetical protein